MAQHTLHCFKMFAFGSYFVTITCVMGAILDFAPICPNVEETFFNQILEEHNEYRKNHDAQPMKFDGLCSRAANLLLNEMLSIPNSTDYSKVCGVNKYTTDLTDVSELNAELAKKIVAFWYETGANYNYLAEPTNNEADPFTQIVWKTSYQLGLQIALIEKGTLYVAATYFLKGNIKGKYLENVKEPQ